MLEQLHRLALSVLNDERLGTLPDIFLKDLIQVAAAQPAVL